MLHSYYITTILYEWEITTNLNVTCNEYVILLIIFRFIMAMLHLHICVCWKRILNYFIILNITLLSTSICCKKSILSIEYICIKINRNLILMILIQSV